MSGKDRVARYEANAPTQTVLFVCEAQHSTEVKFHAQVTELPPQWDCSSCHKPARFVASVTPQSDEVVPDPRRGYVDPSVLNPEQDEDTDVYKGLLPREKYSHFTPEHHAALRARRTEEELEALLAERLAILRSRGLGETSLDS